jgi:hypothetical protein
MINERLNDILWVQALRLQLVLASKSSVKFDKNKFGRALLLVKLAINAENIPGKNYHYIVVVIVLAEGNS